MANPLIALETRGPNISGAMNNALIMQANRQDIANSQARMQMDQQRMELDRQEQQATLQELERKAKDADMQSYVLGMGALGDMLSQGNVEGAKHFWTQRIENIKAKGGDPSDSMEIGKALESGDLETLRARIGEAVTVGSRFGIIKSEMSDEERKVAVLRALGASDEQIREHMLGGAGGGSDPMTIKEWREYQAMSREDQAAYLAMKRAGNVFDVGGVPSYRAPAGAVTPLSTPQEVGSNEAAIAQDKAKGKARGEMAVGADTQISEIDRALAVAQELKTMPGRNNASGVMMGRLPTISQETQNFITKRDQLINILALAARGQLKGQGQVSNFEQDMLMKAQTLLADPLADPQMVRNEIDRIELWLRDKREAQQRLQSSSVQGGDLSGRTDDELRAIAEGRQ